MLLLLGAIECSSEFGLLLWKYLHSSSLLILICGTLDLVSLWSADVTYLHPADLHSFVFGMVF